MIVDNKPLNESERLRLLIDMEHEAEDIKFDPITWDYDDGLRHYPQEPAADHRIPRPVHNDAEYLDDPYVDDPGAPSEGLYTAEEKQARAWWRARAVDAVIAILGGLALYMAWKAAALHGWWWWQS